jgi:hypothetical protein
LWSKGKISKTVFCFVRHSSNKFGYALSCRKNCSLLQIQVVGWLVRFANVSNVGRLPKLSRRAEEGRRKNKIFYGLTFLLLHIAFGFNLIFLGECLVFALQRTVAICGGRDFEAPTYQTVANFNKCTKVQITHNPRLTYIACYKLAFFSSSINPLY